MLIRRRDHNPSQELKSNFIAGTRGEESNPDVAKLETDPKMQEMAQQMGTSVKGLLLLREMMLDRRGRRSPYGAPWLGRLFSIALQAQPQAFGAIGTLIG